MQHDLRHEIFYKLEQLGLRLAILLHNFDPPDQSNHTECPGIVHIMEVLLRLILFVYVRSLMKIMCIKTNPGTGRCLSARQGSEQQ